MVSQYSLGKMIRMLFVIIDWSIEESGYLELMHHKMVRHNSTFCIFSP